MENYPFNICAIEEKKEAVCTLPKSSKFGVIDVDEFVLKQTVSLLNGNNCGVGLSASYQVIGGRNEVHFFSKDYEFLETIKLNYSELISVCFLRGIEDDTLYLSRMNFHAVTLHGKSLFHLKASNERRAKGICVDPNGNIYVAFTNSKISRISNDGRVLDDNILSRSFGVLWDIAFKITIQRYTLFLKGEVLMFLISSDLVK